MNYCTEHEWNNTLAEIKRKTFESHADLIGKIAMFRHCVKNSNGLQKEIYKKELKKLNKKLKDKKL